MKLISDTIAALALATAGERSDVAKRLPMWVCLVCAIQLCLCALQVGRSLTVILLTSLLS